MRDAILHLLAEDPTLEPRDVIVMCPDIETFAPLIHATFGSSEQPRRRHAAGQPARSPRGPIAQADQPGAVIHRAAARPRRPAADGVAGAQPDRPRAGSPALPVRRRRPRPDPELDQPGGDPMGTRCRPPRALPARGAARRHLERRIWTVCCSGVTMTEDGQRLFEDVLPVDDVDSGSIDSAAASPNSSRGCMTRSTRSARRSRSRTGPARSGMPPTR